MFANLRDAQQLCALEAHELEEAERRVEQARERADRAEEKYDETNGFWDDSTFWDASLFIGVVITCVAPEPFSKSICAGGILGGAAGGTASEISRHDENQSALDDWEDALDEWNDALIEKVDAALRYYDCLDHHMTK